MENKDEKVTDEPIGRRTRSGKTVTPPAKPASKKTRKKVMLVEVEVSDDDEPIISKTQDEKQSDIDTIISTNNLEQNIGEIIDKDNDETAVKYTEEVLVSDTEEVVPVKDTEEIVSKVSEELVIKDSDETEILNKVTDELEHTNKENESNESINNVSTNDNDIVTNGSEDKEICAIVENDVFEYDFEKENQNLLEIDTDNKLEDSDAVMMEISDLIGTETSKLQTDDVDMGIVSEAMDVDTSNLSIEEKSEEIDNKTEEIDIPQESNKEIEKVVENEEVIEEKMEELEEKVEEVKVEKIELVKGEKMEKVKEQKIEEVKEEKMEEVKEEIKGEVDDEKMEEIKAEKIEEVKEEKIEETKEETNEEETVKEEPRIKIQPADPDAENISEDELPTVQVAKVPETEEVSDEELPGPKRAELPADTEVVSEDELPAVKKEGTKRKLAEGDYDPGSPTSESEVSAKKPFLEADAEKDKDKVEKPKKLPELDKYWKAVNDDPTDFTGWTYLLQYVDQENDMEAAREAYDAFLSHYPYCYGYWRKYADYEKRKGNKKKCEEVFERGLKAIPLSVDLWIHYLTYVRTSKPDEEEFIRSQFERALSACGLEFRSDRLWDSYIKWETDGKRPQLATIIYDRLLATPTQGYTTHFDNFQEHVSSNPPNKILEVDEFLALRKEVKHMLKHDVTSESADKADAPPGEDTEEVSSDEETKAIRERIISIRRKIHKNTVSAVTGRWNFEEGIKRPYFHVKPLERCQLKNWQDYLDYEVEHGEQTRIIVLFERCLIACALYEEFWLRFVHYLEGLKDPELHQKIKDVYERACTIHHIKKPNLHLQWAMFEESIKNYNKAAEILANIEKSVPNLLQIANRRINLERRREDFEKCSQLYEHYILNSKNKVISTNLAIKYARFSQRILNNVDKSLEVLNTALTKDTNNPRIYLQLIDMHMQKETSCEKEIIKVIDSFLEKESTDIEQKVLFAQRKLEYLEDFGSDIQCVQSAYDDYQKYIKLNKETKKKEPKTDTAGKKEKNPPLPSSQASTYGNYGNYGNSSSTGPYQYSSSQQGQYNYSQYGQSDQYQYGNWQYPQGGYSGYNQWSGYSGGYGY